jgi:flagellar basal body rod protein FlgC
MISAISSAMSGIAGAVSSFDAAAARTARPDQADPVRDRVDELTAQHAFEANLTTIRTADEMVGTLLHVIA